MESNKAWCSVFPQPLSSGARLCSAPLRGPKRSPCHAGVPAGPPSNTEIICCMCEAFVGAPAASFIIRIDGLISREWSRQARGPTGADGGCLALSIRNGEGSSPPLLRFRPPLLRLTRNSQLRFHKMIEKPPRLLRVGGGEFW